MVFKAGPLTDARPSALRGISEPLSTIVTGEVVEGGGNVVESHGGDECEEGPTPPTKSFTSFTAVRGNGGNN